MCAKVWSSPTASTSPLFPLYPSSSPPLRDHRCPFLLLASLGAAKQGRKIDLLRLGNDFQLKDECSGEGEMGDRAFVEAQCNNFLCHVASGQV